jgi:hypothetical protein
VDAALIAADCCVSCVCVLQVVINVVQGFRPDVPEEAELPPGTSSSTCASPLPRCAAACLWSSLLTAVGLPVAACCPRLQLNRSTDATWV